MKNRLFPGQSALVATTFAAAIAGLLLAHSAAAATFTYTRSSANTSGTADQWSTGTNWDSVPVSAATSILTATGTLAASATVFTNNDIGNFQLNRLNFTYAGPGSGTAPTATISGNTLEFTVDGATTPVLSVEPEGTIKPTLTISSIIAGTSGLTKTGAGIVTLSGANTFTGGLAITGGELRVNGTTDLNANGNLGDVSNPVSLGNGAILRSSGDGTFKVGTGRSLTIGSGGGTLAASGFSARTFGFSINGSELLTLAAGSTHIRLNGDNNAFTGGFSISSGAVEFQTAASLPPTGSIAIGISAGLVGSGANATLQEWLTSGRINSASTGALLLTGPANSQNVDFTGYDSLFLGMSGLVDLGAANTVTHTGSITPAGSTYRIGHNIGNAQTLKLDQTNQLTGARNLLVGNGTALGYVWLSGANDYSGGTTVSNNARLTISNAGSAGSGPISVSSGGGLHLRDGITVGNALTLSGGPADLAFGALHSSTGANTYGGNITLGSGSRVVASSTAGNSLTIEGDIALGANSLSFTSGSTAAPVGGNITVAGDISGTGGITKNNATGTLTLAGANSFSGNLTVNGGMLALGSTTAAGTGAGTFTLGAGNGVTAGVRSTDNTARAIGKAFAISNGNATNTYVFGATSGGTGDLSFTNPANTSLGTVIRKFEVNNLTRFSGGFTGAGAGIQKTGTGTLILNGTSTYTGATTVNSGNLGGTGTIGELTAIAGTTIAPGDGGTGTLHTGAATIAGTFAVEVDGTNCDKLVSSGAIDLTGATLTVSLLGGFSGPYVIAEGTAVTGTMSVPSGYAVDISNGTQAILTQTGTPANFTGWASANGVTGGPNGDSDFDGIPNVVEYGLNLNTAGSDGSAGTFTGNVVTFAKRAATSGNSDLSYRIEISPDLGVSAPWVEVGSYLQNNATVISATLPGGPAKNFARLRVIITP